jgi:hypothetical protein
MQDLKELNVGDIICINSDNWDDVGVNFEVVDFSKAYTTTGINLTLKAKGTIVERTVPYQWIVKQNGV